MTPALRVDRGLALNQPDRRAWPPTPDGGATGWSASDGGIFAFGDAGFYGSTGGIALNKPIVGMASTPDGRGYWLVASDGGIFAFGDAGFYGSTGAMTLNKPIVGMAATPDGGGYWLVASDGGIFAFGDAGFYGSTGGTDPQQADRGDGGHPRRRRLLAGGLRRRHLRLRGRRLLRLHRGPAHQRAHRRHAGEPRPGGYWLVSRDGGIFAFGDAHYYGSAGDLHLQDPTVAIS